MKTQTYNQCTLSLQNNPNTKTICWLPSQIVSLNKIVSIKENNTWNDYIIINFGPPHDASIIEEHKDTYRNYIKNTDI